MTKKTRKKKSTTPPEATAAGAESAAEDAAKSADKDSAKDAEKAPRVDSGRPRKERVLHTRVPAVLDQELRRVANSLRVPVSNVVRALLEDALHTVDDFGRKRSPKAAPSAPLAGVVGYQRLVLARKERCVLSDRELAAGEEAWLGIRDVPGPRVIIAPECLPVSVRNPQENKDEASS